MIRSDEQTDDRDDIEEEKDTYEKPYRRDVWAFYDWPSDEQIEHFKRGGR